MTFIGWIAWNTKAGKVGGDSYCPAGRRVYKTEALARAAVARGYVCGQEFTFHKAYAEVPDANPSKELR